MQIRDYEGTNFITGLRAIAILLVFLVHSGGGELKNINDGFNNLVHYGTYGVQMFFVISGFTIFYQIFEKGYRFKKFLLVRVSRISIVYFPIIILIFIYINLDGVQFNNWAIKFNDGNISIQNLLMHLSYLGAFSVKYANTIIGVEWTLNIEVFYYFLFSFLISKLLIKLELINLISVTIILIFMAIAVLFLGYIDFLDKSLLHWMPFQYGYMFLLGGISYYFRKIILSSFSTTEQFKLSNISLFVVIICFIVLIYFSNILPGVIVGGITAFLTFILIIFTKDKAKPSSLFTNHFFMFMGSISYSFYLLHLVILNIPISKFISISNINLIISIKFLIALFVSYISYKIFEVYLYKKIKTYIVSQSWKD